MKLAESYGPNNGRVQEFQHYILRRRGCVAAPSRGLFTRFVLNTPATDVNRVQSNDQVTNETLYFDAVNSSN